MNRKQVLFLAGVVGAVFGIIWGITDDVVGTLMILSSSALIAGVVYVIALVVYLLGEEVEDD